MIEPANLGNFFIIFFSSALIIILGALYALLFAFSFLKNKPHYRYIAYLAYGGLVASTTVLASAANLVNHIFWIFVIALMLFGYFLPLVQFGNYAWQLIHLISIQSLNLALSIKPERSRDERTDLVVF